MFGGGESLRKKSLRDPSHCASLVGPSLLCCRGWHIFPKTLPTTERPNLSTGSILLSIHSSILPCRKLIHFLPVPWGPSGGTSSDVFGGHRCLGSIRRHVKRRFWGTSLSGVHPAAPQATFLGDIVVWGPYGGTSDDGCGRWRAIGESFTGFIHRTLPGHSLALARAETRARAGACGT